MNGAGKTGGEGDGEGGTTGDRGHGLAALGKKNA